MTETQWQPIDNRIQSLKDFKEFVVGLAVVWGEDSDIELPDGFAITTWDIGQ